MLNTIASLNYLILALILSVGVESIAQDEKFIYLTFDDGPLRGSERINDAIEKEQVHITVLLVGQQAIRLPDFLHLYQNNPFIEIGNHSFSHAHGHYKNYYTHPDTVLAEFIRTQEIINAGHNIARFPGRNMWRIGERHRDDIQSGVHAADMLAKNGFILIGWDLEWTHDPKTGEPIESVEHMVNEIIYRMDKQRTFTKNHLVLLCHDEMFQKEFEESELIELIELLKSKHGYKLAHLTDYPGAK